MAIKKVLTTEAVGMVIPHDLTKIVPGSYKGPLFRKGHVIKEEDIPHILDIGKKHIYVLELEPDDLHEDDAILRLSKAVIGDNLKCDSPKEGRINIRASKKGVLKINIKGLDALNYIPDIIVSTRHQNIVVEENDLVAAVKVVPLVVKEALVQKAEKLALKAKPLINIEIMKSLKMGMVIVGGEVFSGRIEDKFKPVLEEKAQRYGLEIIADALGPDEKDWVIESILKQIKQGAELIITTGGMSVDPDDITPSAIMGTGAEIVTYGTPVLPGGMFMLAYLNGVTIMGLPACGMFAKNTIMDIILPRILIGEKLSRKDITDLGYGGLCISCKNCQFETCGFGRR